MESIVCENHACKFCMPVSGCLLDDIKVSPDCRCASFEKGLFYYVKQAVDTLGDGEYIPLSNLTNDICYGLYFMTKLYRLEISIIRCGGKPAVGLTARDNKRLLPWNEIINRETDNTALKELWQIVWDDELPKVDLWEG